MIIRASGRAVARYREWMAATGTSAEVRVLPAGDVDWADLQTVFGTRGEPSLCFCQRFRMQPGESWASVGRDELAARLRDQLDDGRAGPSSPGLVAFLDGEPVGWCALDRRSTYPRLLRNVRVPWEGRDEDKDDDSVWAVTCFVTRRSYRRRGVSRALCVAAVQHARDAGARALEGYPMTTTDALIGELHPGVHRVFVAAGFTEVSRPTQRRAVMRIDF
jgi:GNAT superfamily N-acetyltransferase